MCCGTASCWIADSSLEVFKRGEAERLSELLSWFLATSGVARSESTLLCVFPTCIFKPFSDLKSLSHWSHLNSFAFTGRATFSGVDFSEEDSFSGGPRFFARNSALLLAFLLRVDGLFLFFVKDEVPFPPGVQGKGKGGANFVGEAEDLPLAGQRL